MEFRVRGYKYMMKDNDVPPCSDYDSEYIYWHGWSWYPWSRLRAHYTKDSLRDSTLFKINRESREEALKVYRPVLSSLLPYWRPLRFDFERDTLHLTYDTFIRAVFGLPIPYLESRIGIGKSRSVLSEKGRKELKEFVGCLVHLNYSQVYSSSESSLDYMYEVQDTSSFQSLRIFTVEIYGGPRDGGRPRCFDKLHLWIELSTKTNWIRAEESSQPIDPEEANPEDAPIKFKVVFENTREPRTYGGAKKIDG